MFITWFFERNYFFGYFSVLTVVTMQYTHTYIHTHNLF